MIRPQRGRTSIENIIKQRSTPWGSYPILHPFSYKKYLIRIFINDKKNPKLIITVYKTSKIKKYL
jgi:hypothetical protein